MIAEEYRARLRWRDNPNEGSYSLRFPKQIDRLASLLAEIKAEADADTWNGGNLSGKSLDQDLGGERGGFLHRSNSTEDRQISRCCAA